MNWTWINTTWSAAVMVGVTTIGIYVALIIYTRAAGLRSFSKMSSFDFAMTVAIGSLVASTILTSDPPLLQGAVALGMVYLVQQIVAALRIHFGVARRLVDNEPMLIMEGERILEDAMREARITRGDLLAKLREANVLRLDRVRAVVVESTGDISVLHDSGSGVPDLDDELLEGVRRVEESLARPGSG